ncbi:MAG: hypothetical protein KAT05_06335 [Spirochaetes bacterium]|nr:hypothetical protein [Spirochaetota bacterium]
MKIELKEHDETASFFSSIMENREADKKILPCRAYRKTYAEFYGNYINEVVVGIKKEDLPTNPKGYELFDQTIEPKLNKKTVKNKLNIITFFGDKNTELSELLSFEDVNLLADFEQRYNDHFVTLPFTFKFREQTTKTSQILEDIKKSYSDFVSTISNSNLLGYVPAYTSFRELDKFIEIYTDNSLSVKSHLGKLNFVPLMIDFKEKSPDSYMRSLAKLNQLKKQYLDEGYYLFYYGFSPRTPALSQKRNVNETLAKEFLLSYLGFDVIGASFARFNGGGGGSPDQIKSTGIFETTDYKYHLTTLNKKDYDRAKPRNFTTQTDYFNTVSENLSSDPSFATTELKNRKEAYDYIQLYK